MGVNMKKMKEMKTVDLSNCEKLVLGCVYEFHKKKHKAPSLKDVVSMIEEKYNITWKLQTICTFFSRIEKKGLISVAKNGRYSYYYPVVPYEVYVGQEINELCKIFFGDDKKEFKKFVRQL